MAKRELNYWERHFRHLLSGWSVEQQIQFYEYCLERLKSKGKEGDDDQKE